LNAGMFGPVFINGAVTCHPPAEWWIYHFPDGIWYPNKFILISTRWCQTCLDLRGHHMESV
jgi:hypothetical protein